MITTIHAIGSRRLGGAERFFARLVGALIEKGDPTFAVVRRRAELRRILEPGVQVVPAGMWNGGDLLTRAKIRRLIRRERPRAIQTYLGRATRLTHVPRRSDTVHIARLGGYYRPNAYRHADAWVGNTAGICDYLVREGFPKKRVYLIGNFVEHVPDEVLDVDQAETRQGLGLPADALVVFALGRFIEKKGFIDLITAFADLPKAITGRPVHLVLAGHGPLRTSLESAVNQAGLEARVRFTGWVDDTAAWYRAVDLFVCPSRDEPLGNVVLEAWSHRVAVIATMTAGPEELITSGTDGVLVPTADAKSLARAMHRLLDHEDVRTEIAKNGLITVRRRHDVETVVAQYRDLYERTTRRR